MKASDTTLKQSRLERGLTQAEVSSKAGLSLGHYQQLEYGKHLPGLDVAQKIAAVLGHSVESIWPSYE